MKLLLTSMCVLLVLAGCGVAHEASIKHKPAAIVAVWISPPSPMDTIQTKENEEMLAAQYCAPMMALDASVDVMSAIASQKITKDNELPWVRLLLVNSSTVPPGGLTFLSDRGVRWRDVGQDPFLERFRKAGHHPAGAKEVITVAKLLPLWFTEFSFVLVVDTDLVGQPWLVKTSGSGALPILQTLHAGDDLAYRPGSLSPINAGLYAARPSLYFQELLLSAVHHGFTIADGWGGNYNTSLLEQLVQDHVKKFVKQLPVYRCNWKMRPCCLEKPAMWCFIGRDQDQGLLLHILLSGHIPNSHNQSREMRTDMLSAVSQPQLGDLNRLAFKHFAYQPKPFEMEKWGQKLKPYIVNPTAADEKVKKTLMRDWRATVWFWTKLSAAWKQDILKRNDTVCLLHFDEQASIFQRLRAKGMDVGLELVTTRRVPLTTAGRRTTTGTTTTALARTTAELQQAELRQNYDRTTTATSISTSFDSAGQTGRLAMSLLAAIFVYI